MGPAPERSSEGRVGSWEGKLWFPSHEIRSPQVIARQAALSVTMSLIALTEAMSAPATPERFFAIEAVKRVGTITLDKLSDTEIVFTRFVKAFAGESPERRARAFGIMASVIATIDRREPLGALYSEVNRRLMFDLGFPAPQ